MSEIPLRLLVISARVPEGERCDGCQFYHVSPPETLFAGLDWCDDPNLHGSGCSTSLSNGNQRLPECRERDGWRCYPPDSGVAELVEAAKVYAAGLANPRPWEIGSPVTCLDRLEQAASKVAKESNDVPRD